MDKIIELRKEIAKLKKLAYKDPLTGLYNRRGFIDEAARMMSAVELTSRHKRKFSINALSVIFLDLDDFRKINNNYGHDAGDTVLKSVSHTIVKHLRQSDIVCRFGGEEIVIALIGTIEKDAEGIADGLRERISELKFPFKKKTIFFKDEPVRITASFGVSEMKAKDTLESLIKRADNAMYKAKKAGKNRVAKN